MQECVRLYENGLSHKAIAQELGVGKTTVGTWLKQLLV